MAGGEHADVIHDDQFCSGDPGHGLGHGAVDVGAADLAYRLVTTADSERVLFLVDRANLGRRRLPTREASPDGRPDDGAVLRLPGAAASGNRNLDCPTGECDRDAQPGQVSLSAPTRQPSDGIGTGGPSRAPSIESQEENRRVGRRGEEVAYYAERRRLEALGKSPDSVHWISKTDEVFPYDLLIVDDDDQLIYIEVKATRYSDPTSPSTSHTQS